jgi:hypothetical protein
MKAKEELKKDLAATPKSEDIYDRSQKAINIHQSKEEDELKDAELNEDLMGDDMDVPGSDLDDGEEAIGTEDEENNYYSIGGDEHNDLDEHDS